MSRAASRKSLRQPALPAVPPEPPPPVDGALLGRCAGLLIALALLTMVAALLFRTRATTVGGSEMNWDRAVFFAVNAATLSGFRLPVAVGDLKGFGQLIVYLLVATATLTYLLVGGWSLKRIARYDLSDLELTRFTLIVFLLGTLLGGSLLLGNGVGLFQSIFNATAALGNCGWFLGRLPELRSLKLQAVLLPLAIIGGLSMPVVQDLWRGLTHYRRVVPHTVAALLAAAVVYLLFTPLLWVIEAFHTPMPTSLLQASALTLDSRTLGHPIELSALTPAAPWLLMILMMIGAGTGGSGGGVKGNTLLVIACDVWAAFRGGAAHRLFAAALFGVFGYVALVIMTVLSLSLAEPTINGATLLFTAVSAVSNCGLSQQPINFGSAGLYVMSVAMLAGRIGSIALLLLCVQQRITGDVAVG